MITAQVVDEMRERFCVKCSRLVGCPVLAEALTGVRPDQWVHPPRRAIVLVCKGFKADGQPKKKRRCRRLEMFDAESERYRHVPVSTKWDDYDAATFGRNGRGS